MQGTSARRYALVKWTILPCAALLGAFYLMAWKSVETKSATVDEPLHACAGYLHLFERDFRINPEDPPLWKYWAMLPHRAGELRPDPDVDLWNAQLNEVGYQFVITSRRLYQVPGNDGAVFIDESRTVMLLIGVFLGAVLACWTWILSTLVAPAHAPAPPTAHAAAVATITATILFCFDPTILAHAPLIKNDVALSLFMFCAVWTAWSVGRHARWWNVLLMALSLSAAITTKFSGVLVVPMLLLIMLARATLLKDPWAVIGRELRTTRAKIAAATSICSIAVLVAWLCIWAAYGFRYDPTPTAGARLNISAMARETARSRFYLHHDRPPTPQELDAAPTPLVARVSLAADDLRLFPQAWTFGFLYTYESTLLRPGYLLGEQRTTGWWYYFPLAMLFKTPVATIVAAILATAVGIFSFRKRSTEPRAADQVSWEWVCLGIPIVVYGAIAMSSNLNLGVRHVLPVYPFLYAMIGLATARARLTFPRAFAPAASVLALGLVIESLVTFPHYLSFFNAPSRPHRLLLLSDSNFDWGQDLTYVADWQRRHPSARLYLGYFGTVDPAFYRISYVNLPGGFKLGPRPVESVLPNLQTGAPVPTDDHGFIAVSATLLQGGTDTAEHRDLYRPLRHRRPREIIGDSIYLYDYPLRDDD
jgi:hypothetical protein